MSESEIIQVYHEGIQSVVTLIQGLSTQILDLSKTVWKQNKTITDLDARLKKIERQGNKISKNSILPPSTDSFNKTKSLREPSNKKLDGQARYKGTTLKWSKILILSLNILRMCARNMMKI